MIVAWLQSLKDRAKYVGQNNQSLENCNIFSQNNYEFARVFWGAVLFQSTPLNSL